MPGSIGSKRRGKLIDATLFAPLASPADWSLLQAIGFVAFRAPAMYMFYGKGVVIKT